MTQSVTHTKGNRNPSLTDRITVNGAAVDTSVGAWAFSMRAVGSATLKVNAAVAVPLVPVLVTDPNIRYDWAAIDVDTADTYLGWWTGTIGGKTQDTPEFLIYMEAHDPGATSYLTIDAFKNSTSMTGQDYANEDIQVCLAAASRALETEYRNFWTLGAPGEVRYYTAMDLRTVPLGDVYAPTQVALDLSYGTGDWGPGTYGQILAAGTGYRLLPIQNGPAGNQEAYQFLELARQYVPPYFPQGQDAIRITGQFGFGVVPPAVQSAVSIIATRVLKRMREAPYGVFAVGVDGVPARSSDLAKDPEIKAIMRSVSGPLLY